MSENNISFGNLTWQLSSNAAWHLDGSISLDSQDYEELPDPNDIKTLALIAHEAKHLEQGPITALSVYGELEAHQVQYNLLKSEEKNIGDDREAILNLPLSHDEEVLEEALDLFEKMYGRKYLVWLLPKNPLITDTLSGP